MGEGIDWVGVIVIVNTLTPHATFAAVCCAVNVRFCSYICM